MSDARVSTTWSGRTAVLTLERPAKRNALDEALFRALGEAARAVAAQSPRAVILTGAGGHFCAGLDLSPENPLLGRLAAGLQAGDDDVLGGLIDELNHEVDAIARLPCPTIAAIEGACVGAGLELALACDLRVAGSGARFALPETRVGLVPDVGGTRRLVALVGRARAAELIVTCRDLELDEALAWGLVNRRAMAGGALDAALALAEQARVAGPAAVREALAYLRELGDVEGETTRHAERRAGLAALRSGEALEGAMAFAQRRRPRWAVE